MAERRRRRRRSPKEEEEIVEEDVQVEEQEEEEEEEEEVVAQVEEEEEEAPAPRRRRKRTAAPRAEEDTEDEGDDEEDTPRRKRAERVDLEEVSEKSPIAELLDLMREGESVFITKTVAKNGKVTWQADSKEAFMASAGAPRGRRKLKATAAYWDLVLTQEYKDWQADWQKMSFEEKVKYAQDNDIKYEDTGEPRTTMMSISQAVRDAEDIKKYKKKYSTSAARKEAKLAVAEG